MDKLRGMIQEYVKALAVIRELESNKEQLKHELIRGLHQLVPVTENQTLDELLSIAEKKQKEIHNHVNNRNNIEASIREIKDKVKQIANKKIEIETKITDWDSDWTNAIQGTTISANTPPSVAERLVSIYESCAQAYEEFKKVEKEQEAIQEQIALFKEKVKNILRTVELSLDEQYVDIAVNQLNASFKRLDKIKDNEESQRSA